jgi:hypothetical protein
MRYGLSTYIKQIRFVLKELVFIRLFFNKGLGSVFVLHMAPSVICSCHLQCKKDETRHTRTYEHMYVLTYVPTYVHAYVHTHTNTYIHTHTYIHIHTYIYIHTCTFYKIFYCYTTSTLEIF